MRTPSCRIVSSWPITLSLFGDEDRLGDLEREPGGVGAGAGERAFEVVQERAVAELQRGDVDGDRRFVDAVERPGRELVAGGFDDPRADGDDGAGLLGDRDELAGREECVVDALPAQERFEAGDGRVVGADDGLVVQDELAGRGRVAECVFDLAPVL